MAFTSVDLDNVETAIKALMEGERVTSVTMDGRTVSYAREDLTSLLNLRDRIKLEIQQTAGNKRYRRTASGRGL